MDIQAIRDEVALLLPTTADRPAYGHTPGTAQVPCYVVGLPDSINPTEGSYSLLQIQLPVYALGPHNFTKEGEAQLLTMAAGLLPILRAAPSGTAYRSLRVVNIDRIGELTISETKYLAAAVNLIILATNS